MVFDPDIISITKYIVLSTTGSGGRLRCPSLQSSWVKLTRATMPPQWTDGAWKTCHSSHWQKERTLQNNMMRSGYPMSQPTGRCPSSASMNFMLQSLDPYEIRSSAVWETVEETESLILDKRRNIFNGLIAVSHSQTSGPKSRCSHHKLEGKHICVDFSKSS